jgi:hypothetical protein
VLTLSTSGEGPNPCSSGHISTTHQSLLHCTLSLAIHFNGSNGIAYTRLSKVQNSPKGTMGDLYEVPLRASGQQKITVNTVSVASIYNGPPDICPHNR